MSARAHRLAQTRVWGAAAASHRAESGGSLWGGVGVGVSTAGGRLARPASVFGQLRASARLSSRGSAFGGTRHASDWRGDGRGGIDRGFDRGVGRSMAALPNRGGSMSMAGRRAQSFHRYARVPGTLRTGGFRKADLEAIDEGLGAVQVVETPAMRPGYPDTERVEGLGRAGSGLGRAGSGLGRAGSGLSRGASGLLQRASSGSLGKVIEA